ncbi:hypothetical protein DNAOFDDG_02224 [Mannheimia haemolytica]|uniref:Uncharacterized protein n=1 Tax=Mannheimia haemolytica TaxID=75985 RepID=A0A378NHY4_MANHA|nr:hypothetical protein F382_03455 [Mannheimia haemolytica D153]AGQ38085.1 hypothetical protein J450_02655 [Mannheimia haemolytica D171]AGQ40637.1 hypothetical protein J451_03760 [Mannheimia haemolytica D174]AGR75534.1 hypothetical protein N220_09550 [Mannheimia haemolytica USMARC_2286]EDN74439.1 hypothetical protein MHA_1518 [Mannheimia haemolytica PHL213]EPZ01819.1 hypothetical protein L279_11640 [Mannheimia haemolytica D38]EPZ24131.1 hypothetical protein L277_13290 [Mannheimia haemolytica 
MKDLSIKDCEIIYGGIAPLWWDGTGITSYWELNYTTLPLVF